MFSGTDEHVPSTDGAFTDTLRQLKRTGASVLVVGSVQPEQRRDVRQRLFGQSTAQSRRRVLVSTTNQSDESLVPTTDVAGDTFRHIVYDAPSRSASADETAQSSTSASSTPSTSAPTAETTTATPTSTASPHPHTEADTLSDLGIEISSAIESFDIDADGLEPAELRVGIDSLLPLLEEYDQEQVFTFLHLLTGRTEAVDGMFHCHLPVERDATVVAVLSPIFDIVLELRDQNGLQQERWVLGDGEQTSGWITPPQA